MSSAQSLFEAFVIMIVALLSSVIITFFILMPMEIAHTQIVSTGVVDAPPEWQTGNDIDFYVSVGYWLTYFLDFYAVGQFVWTAVRKQRYDLYGNLIEEM